MEQLKPFFGSRQGAIDLAKRDTDQYNADKIVSYWGDPDSRFTMEFHDSVWLPYTQDIFQMIQYEDFCNNTPGLYFLQYSSSIAERNRKEVNKQPITSLKPGESICFDIRTWGAQ